MKEIILNILKDSRNYKKVAWFFIIIVLLLLVLYPIIDANFLYYKRVSNRIDILDKINNIEVEKIESNKKLKQEYNSILNEIAEKENNYLNNIFIKEDSTKNNIIKFISSLWLFIIVGLILPFMKDNEKKSINNILGGLLCVCIGVAFGFIGYKIPTIINIIVNIILYQIIMIYLAYTIATLGDTKS